jgi:hypothetical protein
MQETAGYIHGTALPEWYMEISPSKSILWLVIFEQYSFQIQ